MRNKNIRFFLFGSVLSCKKFSDINDIDIFILYDKKKVKNINKKVECMEDYIINTYSKKAHLTILNYTEYNNLNENLIEAFKLRELSLKEIKKCIDAKYFEEYNEK